METEGIKMATIREHEPAEGLRKENREISAKMKEDEQMQKDTDAEKRTERLRQGHSRRKRKILYRCSVLRTVRPAW